MMDLVATNLAGIAELFFQALKLLGGVLALIATGVVVLGMLRSIWSVTVGQATLIIPFHGSEVTGVWVSGLLGQELNRIEDRWKELKENILSERASAQSAETAALIDLGRSRVSETTQNKKDEEIIAPSPLEGQAIGPISFGAASFSPESIFALFDVVRSKLARRVVSGQVDQFGDTLRISAVYSEWGHANRTVVLTRESKDANDILPLIADVAFQICKARLNFKSEAKTWAGYEAFLEGYRHHLGFISTGETHERDAAIASYGNSVQLEPEHHLARYNLGILHYGMYTAADNEAAIEHLRVAAQSLNPVLEGLAQASVSRAYFQQVHRFGHKVNEVNSWDRWAEEASQRALKLIPALEEAHLARGFALQLQERYDEAVQEYQKVVDLPGNSSQEKALKSMALNNLGYIYMKALNDPQKAESLFKQTLTFNRFNKMAHANLGELLKRRGEFPSALGEFEEATKIDAGYVNGYNEMAMVHVTMAAQAFKEGRPEEAKANLQSATELHEKAVSLVPEDQTTHIAEVKQRFALALKDAGLEEEPEALEEKEIVA